MPKPTFEQALAECLRDLHEGRATVDSCLERWPQFPELLGHLETGASLRSVSAVPEFAKITAGAAMRRALVGRAAASPGASGSFFRLVPKALVASVAALILAGGAAGASAAVGGPNIPARLLSAIAALTANSGDEHAQPGAAGATATGTAAADAGSRGACVAYFAGSDRARLQREDAAAFKRITEQAADGGQSVDDYCNSIAPDRTPGPGAEVPGRGAGDAPRRDPRSSDDEPNGKRPEGTPGRSPSATPSTPNQTEPSRGRP